MNNEHKKKDSSRQGGARAPFHHPLQDDQDYAHKNFSAQGKPSGYVKNTQVQGYATSSQKK